MSSAPSLKRSLHLAFAIVAAAPLLLVSVMVLFELTVGRYREIDEQNMLLAQAVSGQVESFLQQPQATIAGLVALHKANPGMTAAHMQAALDALVESSSLFESFYFADSDGIVRYVGLPVSRRHLRGDFLGTDLSHLAFFQKARNSRQTTWSDTFLSLETGHTSIAIASALDGQILVGHFSIDRLTEFVASLQMQPGIDVSIIDRSGAIIVHTDPVLAASQVKVGHLPPVRAAILGSEGTQRYRDGLGEHLGSAVLIHGPEWITLVSRSVDMAEQPIRKTALLFLGGTVAALLLAMLFAALQTQRLTTPLSELSARAELVASGDYTMPIAAGGSREVATLSTSFARMVTAIRSREEEIVRSQAHYRLLVETMREGLFVVDPELRLTFTNPRFAEMLGYGEAELLQRSVLTFLDAANQALVKNQFVRRSNNEKTPYELEWIRKDGSSITTIVAPQPLFEGDVFSGSLVVVTDISRLKRAEVQAQLALAEAEAARDQIDAILRSTPHALVVTDLHGRVLLMNREAELLSGKAQGELAGFLFKSVFHAPAFVDYLEKTLQQQTIQPGIDIELLHHGLQEVRTFRAGSAFVGDVAEAFSGLVIALQDMTRERESDRLKSEFIAVAAHELNTPLTSIIGYSELLLGEDADFSAAERLEFLRVILSRGYALGRIVDDLLHLGRMESGRALKLELEAVDIDELIAETVAEYQRENPDRSFLQQLPQETTTVMVDPVRIGQILGNLLVNALKYSPEGSPITVTGARDGDWYRLTVGDQGIGMTADEVERVFEKFYRVHSALSNIGGLGLGMTIVKNIVDAHHGEIAIDSTPGRGTTVTVRLPLQPPA